jgi:signal transduction histidine kinase
MMEKSAAAPAEEGFLVLSSLPPSRSQKRLALAVLLCLLVTFLLAAGPLAHLPMGDIVAFPPAYATALLLSETITAVLLFSQFSILRTWALLVISSGYCFTVFMLVLWAMTFPFAGTALVGGLQSPPYLYFYWHLGFPLFVIVYALTKDVGAGKHLVPGNAGAAIALSIAGTAALALLAAYLFIAENSLLPRLQLDVLVSNSSWYYGAAITLGLTLVALVTLWVRRRSILDLWLMVSLCAYGVEPWLTYPERYNFSWYAGKAFGLLSSIVILLVLLYEITTLYAQLLRALVAQRREREARMMTGDAVAASIAHEVNQPLTGLVARANACLQWLEHAPPDLENAKNAIRHALADAHRAGAVVTSIRAMFKKEGRATASLDINDLVRQALALVGDDLTKHRVVVEAVLASGLPQVAGDPVQLRQVVLNLIANAIDAMATTAGSRVLSLTSEADGDGAIVVSVADTGVGIRLEEMERIFNPLFSTKSGGMGMGLAICRAIIEAHGGELSATANGPRGAMLRFVLPVDAETSDDRRLARTHPPARDASC